MSQAGYTPIQLYYSTTAAAAPSAGNLAAGELAVNITDGKLFYKDNGGVVRVLATAAGSAGDVVGPGSSTDNALVRFDGTTGKLVQNSVGVLSDAGALSGLASVAATTFTGALTGNASTATTLQTSRTIWGQSFDGSANVTGALTGVTDLTASGSLTLNGGTANGVAYLNGSKVLTTGSALTFDGTNFATTGSVTSAGASNSGNLTFSGTGNRITGDFSTATLANRVYFQTSTANSLTSVGLIPNGTGIQTQLSMFGSTDVTTNFSLFDLSNTSSEARFRQVSGGTAPFLPMTFYTGGSERMRVDTSGNVGINTSSAGSKLTVLGTGSFYASTNANTGSGYGFTLTGANSKSSASDNTSFALFSNDALASNPLTLAMSLVGNATVANGYAYLQASEYGTGNWRSIALNPSGGNLLVGTTSASLNNNGFRVIGDGSTNAARLELGSASTTNSNIGLSMYSTGASAYRFYVGWGGTIFATSIVITAISDQRLKENVRDIDTGLDSIMALKPRRYDWKEGKGQNKKNVAGFIAQEFETVFPECVGTSQAGEDGIEYKNINHETLIPTLVKAIQEQQALIESLTTRLAAAGI